ncbi:MAG TPA: DUF3427 domain-containing protein [Burkholderiaceae bacterium]|nr:DUF3427 domain-containing protein [Burkholderiaceae bacterium]
MRGAPRVSCNPRQRNSVPVQASRFHWQSQNATTPQSKRGQEVINHEALGIAIHLFVRDSCRIAGRP